MVFKFHEIVGHLLVLTSVVSESAVRSQFRYRHSLISLDADSFATVTSRANSLLHCASGRNGENQFAFGFDDVTKTCSIYSYLDDNPTCTTSRDDDVTIANVFADVPELFCELLFNT